MEILNRYSRQHDFDLVETDLHVYLFKIYFQNEAASYSRIVHGSVLGRASRCTYAYQACIYVDFEHFKYFILFIIISILVKQIINDITEVIWDA